MSKDKKTKPISGDTARKIWLAGIGAYGRAFGEAQEQLTKVTKGGGKMFDELAAKGEIIETMVSYKGKEIAKDAMEKVGSVSGGLDLDDRIAKMRSRLKRVDGSDVDEVEGGLEDRLDKLEVKLDEVLKLLKPAPKKRTPRKPAAKKKPTSKAKK